MDELAQLENQAAAIDATASAAADPGQVPEKDVTPPDVAAEVAALVKTVADLLTPAFPSLGLIYTPETCDRLGAAAAPVMEKYGWTVGEVFGKWGPEIGLAVAALPVVVATVKAVRHDIEQRRNPPPPADDGGAGQGSYAQDRAL